MNKFSLEKEIKNGVYYFLVGQICFFRERCLWKYALLPLFCMLLFYLLLLAGMVLFLQPLLAVSLAKIENSVIGESLLYLSPYFLFGICLLLVWMTQNLLYQCFGAFIFDELSECYEQTKYGYTCDCPAQQRRKAMLESFLLSSKNFFLGIGLFLLSTAVFGWGTLICTPLLGYLLGISYFQACAVNHGVYVRTLKTHVHKHFLTITVFGICSVFVQMLPFSTFILTPGFFVGGCHLFWDYIEPELVPENHN